MNRIFTVFLKITLTLVVSGSMNLKAQIIELGTGTFIGSNISGPLNTSTAAGAASRYAYIFPASTVSTLKHGDTIVSLDFLRNSGGSLSGTVNMKIYMRTTVNSDYGTRSINWVNQTGATGMKKVYDRNPASEIGSINNWMRFTLDTAFVFDTIFGKGLEILVEYRQTSSQSTNINWTYENRYTVNGYALNQCKYTRTNGGTLTDTTNNSTDGHPTIKINFPRDNKSASVLKVYSLGKIPVPLGNPDSVKVLIKNVGKRTMTNHKMYIESKGANKLIDSAIFTLGSLRTGLFTLPVLSPTNLGLDTLVVRIAPDQDSSDNAAQTYRIATENIYSYKDPTQSLAGGIGFNGGTGDFVAKFYSNTAKAINQISVSFAGSTQKFKLGIWAANGTGGQPGTNLWISDTLTTSPSFVTPVLPPVSVNGSFFVGVRQIGTTNVAFGYQEEDPVRPQTFYYASPYGDTNWVDFAPDAPFKFAIEPRLQADNDVAPLSMDFPKDTVDLTKVKMMAPKATIINYGAKNQTTAFTTSMIIKRYGSVVYTSNKSDTLGSLRKRKITFDSTFLPTQAGDYDVMIITRLGSDQMKDNDTLKKKIVVANYKDVGIGSLFDPDIYTDYEQFIDSVFPIANIQNFGLDNTSPFNITVKILDSSNNLLYSDTKTTSLTSGSSNIVVFKTYPCSVKGRLKFMIYTAMTGDTRKKNDTLILYFNVVRSNDVTVTKSIYPAANKGITPPATAKFVNVELENLGDLNQGTPFLVYNRIYYKNSMVYTDSQEVTSFRGITTNIFFKKFTPALTGYYTMVCFSALPNDQVKKNDTLRINFAYGLPDDIQPVNIVNPTGLLQPLNKKAAPKVTISNNGFNAQNTSFDVVFKVRSNTSVIYSDTKSTTLDSGQTKTIVFDSSLVFQDTGIYIAEAYTALGIDFDKTNDTIRTTYEVNKYYDLGAESILYPTEADTLQVNVLADYPTVRIMNMGDSLVTDYFTTTLEIINSNTKAVLYKKSRDTFFSANSPIDMQFPRPLFTGAQPLTVHCYTDYAKDEYRRNDSAKANTVVEVWYDAQAMSIAIPQNGFSYKTNSSLIKPVVSIKNGGKQTIDFATLVVRIKQVDTATSLETTVYEDSTDVSSMNSLSTGTLTFTNGFDFTTKSPGVYRCYYNIRYLKDQVVQNNGMMATFRIQDASGIKLIQYENSLLYPNPASNFVTIVLNNSPKEAVNIMIVDMNGRKVMESAMDTQQMTFDISTLANGTYHAIVDGKSLTFVVQH